LLDPEEPWEEWLTPRLAGELRGLWRLGVSDQRRQAVLLEVSNLVEQEAKRSLGVPLVVLYDVAQDVGRGQGYRPWLKTCDLVLPSGAKLTIREHEKDFTVRSCYFIGQVCRTPANVRWRLLVRRLLERYARDNGDGTYSPDPFRPPWRTEETGEVIYNPRFRTEASWRLDGRQVRPWETMPDPWPVVTPPPTPGPLRPRRTY
jgi:hypothetical protein